MPDDEILKSINDKLYNIAAKLGALEKLTHSPGDCDLATEVKDLMAWKNRQQGAWAAVAVISSSIAAVISGIIVALVSGYIRS